MKIQYGTLEIQFTQQVNPRLKHAYVTVDFHEGVILKSPPVSPERAVEIVRGKAAWIIQKLKLVQQEPMGDIVTGTRVLYLGKRYYTKVITDKTVSDAVVTFNYSTFKVSLNPGTPLPQEAVSQAFDRFYREKAAVKVAPRVRYWSRITGLEPSGLSFRRFSKRWGSCTAKNGIVIDFDAVKLPYSLIDYIVVHELCHILHKGHGKEFWKEVEKYLPGYKELEDRIAALKC